MSTTEAITYRTGTSARDLRTVLVEDVRTQVMVVGGQGITLLLAKQLHGTSQCGHEFWEQELGTSGDDFVIPASQVVAQRPISVAVKVTHKREAGR